jgi:hypothetical protein
LIITYNTIEGFYSMGVESLYTISAMGMDQYELKLPKAIWFSPIQSSDFNHAILIKFGEIDILSFNYTISRNMANVFLTIYQEDEGLAFEMAIDRLIRDHNEITVLITYVNCPENIHFFSSDKYIFQNSGYMKKAYKYNGKIYGVYVYYAKITTY